MRPRDAPSASRLAISLRRAMPSPVMSALTLVHVTSRTSNPNAVKQAVMSFTSCSKLGSPLAAMSGTTSAVDFGCCALDAGNCGRAARSTDVLRDAASDTAAVAPLSARRAQDCRRFQSGASRVSAAQCRACRESGSHTLKASQVGHAAKRGATTPLMVTDMPSTTTVCTMTSHEAEELRPSRRSAPTGGAVILEVGNARNRVP